jgi:hypothetical protein
MDRRYIALLKIIVLLAVIAGLILVFPKALGFVEMGARELRYLWWLILLVALAVWLIWGIGGKAKK